MKSSKCKGRGGIGMCVFPPISLFSWVGQVGACISLRRLDFFFWDGTSLFPIPIYLVGEYLGVKPMPNRLMDFKHMFRLVVGFWLACLRVDTVGSL